MPWPGKWPKSWRRLCRRRSRTVLKAFFIKVRFLCPFRGIRTGFSFCQNVSVRGARLQYSSPLPEVSGNMRFSCREAETYCQRYADLTCHEACRKIGLTVCGRLKCKYMSMFSRQSDILFLLGKTFQIEKKRPERIRSFPVFRPFFSRCTEVAGMMCGEKKCFFLRLKNYSLECEAPIRVLWR